MRNENRYPAIDFMPENSNEPLIFIEDFHMLIANTSLAQLGMSSPNRALHDILS